MKENSNSSDRKIADRNDEISTKNKNKKIGFYKFLFGVKSPIGNFYLFLGIFLSILYSVFNLISEMFYGFCINLIETKNMNDLKIYSLILGISGVAFLILSLLSGVFFNKHSDNLCRVFKEKYYSLVYKQDFEWYNKQDLNKLSESIKDCYDKFQSGVNFILYFFINFFKTKLFY